MIDALSSMNPWKWRVRLTYNGTVRPPKVPGALAIETSHADDSSKDLEVAAAEARGDVDVEVIRVTGRRCAASRSTPANAPPV